MHVPAMSSLILLCLSLTHDQLPDLDVYGEFEVSAPPELSSTMKAGTSYMQDGYDDVTSFPHGQVEGTTPSSVVTSGKGQNVTIQEVSRQRERKAEEKRERDKERKKIERSSDKRTYKRICELLEISLAPRNTLADRSEFLCIHPCQRH